MFLDIFGNCLLSEFERDLSDLQICRELKISLDTKYLFIKDWMLRAPYIIDIDESAPDGMWGVCPITKRRNVIISNLSCFSVDKIEFSDIRGLSSTMKAIIASYGVIITGGTVSSDCAESLIQKIEEEKNDIQIE